jgi:hypothetical protein
MACMERRNMPTVFRWRNMKEIDHFEHGNVKMYVKEVGWTIRVRNLMAQNDDD